MEGVINKNHNVGGVACLYDKSQNLLQLLNVLGLVEGVPQDNLNQVVLLDPGRHLVRGQPVLHSVQSISLSKDIRPPSCQRSASPAQCTVNQC